MKIIFYGGKQAGMVVLLTLLALKEKIVCVIPIDEIVEQTARNFKLNIKRIKDINKKKFVNYLKSLKPDLFVCCHGRQILKKIFYLLAVSIYTLVSINIKEPIPSKDF
jgi:methionyl-tRNA formyltransferase